MTQSSTSETGPNANGAAGTPKNGSKTAGKAKSEAASKSSAPTSKAGAEDKNGASKAQSTPFAAPFGDYARQFDAMNAQFADAMPFAKPYFDALEAYWKDAVAAWSDAGAVTAKRAEALGGETAAYGQAFVDAAMENARKVMGAKSPQDAIALQAEFAAAQFEASVDQAGKFSSQVSALFAEAVAPLQASIEKSVKPVFGKPTA